MVKDSITIENMLKLKELIQSDGFQYETLNRGIIEKQASLSTMLRSKDKKYLRRLFTLLNFTKEQLCDKMGEWLIMEDLLHEEA